MSEIALPPPDEVSIIDAPPPVTGPPNRRKKPANVVAIALASLIGVVGGTALANHFINSGSSVDQSMGQWMSAYGNHYLGVSHAYQQVNVDANTQNVTLASIRSDCAALGVAVNKSKADPPMPAPTLAPLWSSVLTELGTGAQTCVRGIDERNGTVLNEAQSDFNKAQQRDLALIKAVEKID